MLARKLSMIPASVLLLAVAGCQTTKPAADLCDGWETLTPAAQTRQFIIKEDRTFAEQVAAHISFGRRQGCWK